MTPGVPKNQKNRKSFCNRENPHYTLAFAFDPACEAAVHCQ
jgi:hypothetical protein